MVVKDSLLYVVAGAKNFGMGFDKELWVYNLNSNDWEQRADITIEDCHFPMQFSVGDDIYIAGSHGDEDSFMKYNYASNTWTAFNNQLGSRHTGVALEYNGKVYFIGGSEGTHNELLEEQAFVEYDPIMDTYTSLNPAEDYNKEFANAFIIGTELYVFGGVPNFFGSDHTKTMWKTDLSLLNPSTSLDESTYGVKELSISPNPVDDILNISDLDISKEKYSVIIYDALASQVYSGLLNRSDLNLSSLKSGLYTLLVFSDSEHFSTSFIKI